MLQLQTENLMHTQKQKPLDFETTIITLSIILWASLWNAIYCSIRRQRDIYHKKQGPLIKSSFLLPHYLDSIQIYFSIQIKHSIYFHHSIRLHMIVICVSQITEKMKRLGCNPATVAIDSSTTLIYTAVV